MPTVTIDDAAFAEAKDLAEQRHQTVDEVVTAVLHDALKIASPDQGSMPHDVSVLKARDSFPVLPRNEKSRRVTLEMVKQIEEQQLQEDIHRYGGGR